jgi:hypothetical protein
MRTASGYGSYDLLTFLQVAAANESICYHLFDLVSLWYCHKFVSIVGAPVALGDLRDAPLSIVSELGPVYLNLPCRV